MKLLLFIAIAIIGVVIHDIFVLHQRKINTSISNEALEYFVEHTRAVEMRKE